MKDSRSGGVKRVVRFGIATLSVLCVSLGLSSCAMFEFDPKTLPNFDNSDKFILDYAVGDRFETLKPMFMTKLGNELLLLQPGLGAPSLLRYAAAPGDFRHVVRLVPAGTKFALAAIKDAGCQTSTTYIQLEGLDEWVGVSLGEYVDVGTQTHRQYNREYFRKL